jgi:hypothetical protein
MVGDDGCQATEVAFLVSFLPISVAENAVKTNKGGRGLLIRPCISASFLVNLLE